LSAPALAQESPAQDTEGVPSPEADELVGPGIIVTARRREESARDVPISLSVFGEQELLETNVEGLDDISLYTPNLVASWDFNPQFTTISIRGLTSNTSNGGIDPSVGVFLDGVYLARPEMYSTELADIERVEVLRGPQGALYGKNTTVGAINIITREPSDVFQGRVDATIGNFDQRRVRGWVNVPISDQVSGLVSGFVHRRDGFTTNTVNGEDLGRTDSQGVRAKLRVEPTPTLDITGTVEYYEDDADGTTGDFFILSPLTGLLEGDTNPRDYRNAVNDNEVVARESYGYTLTANLTASDDITITSITAYRELDFDLVFDFDTTPAQFIQSGKIETQSQFTQELRAASDFAGPFNFVVGAFYLDSELDQLTETVIGPALIDFELVRQRPFLQNTSSMALFGELSWQPTDRLQIAAGLRYTAEDRDVVTSQSGLDIPTLDEERLARSETDLSPTLTVTYEASPFVTLFARYARGFKSGGFNAATVEGDITDFSGTEFEEETADSWEAGVKAVTPDGRLAVNIAAFYTLVQDLQVSDFDGDQIVVRNAAEAESYGIEADFNWTPIDELLIAGSVGFNPTRYVSYPDAPGNPPIPPNPPTRDLSGEPLSRAPEFNASIRARYEFDLLAGSYAAVDYTYLSEHFLGAEIDPASLQDDYGLLNARIGVNIVDDLEVAAWARNLTDEYYFTAVAAPFGDVGRIGWPGQPRTYGVDVIFSF
jgi:iron complex outermembrane receptor protein